MTCNLELVDPHLKVRKSIFEFFLFLISSDEAGKLRPSKIQNDPSSASMDFPKFQSPRFEH